MQIQEELSPTENGKEVEISVATFGDLGDLVTLADVGLTQLPNYAKKGHTREQITYAFTKMLHHPNKIIFLARVRGACVGAFAAYIEEHWFARRLFSENIFVYIIPEHRGRGLVGMFLMIYKGWAQARGAQDILFEFSSGLSSSAAERLLHRYDYIPLGQRFILEEAHG